MFCNDMINLENYEIYIIDYLDGKLSVLEVDNLLAFLDLHPSIKEDFYAIAHSTIKELDIPETYPDKEKLKKNYIGKINNQNITEYLILNLENELNPSQKKTLKTLLNFFLKPKKS